jgi:hypothetical protein
MGNTGSKLPSGKNYTISYTKHLKFKSIPDIPTETNLVTGIKVRNETHLEMIYSVFYYNINNNGYSLKGRYPYFNITGTTLEDIFKSIIKRGIWSMDNQTKLSDITILPKCYSPKLKTLRSLIYLGNVLIAGLLIDKALSQILFKVEFTELVTEIVLILGYTEKEILIKGIWSEETISIPNEYSTSIKEVWNIEIHSPEDKYLEIPMS